MLDHLIVAIIVANGVSCGNESELGARLGEVAYLRAGRLYVTDLSSCEERLLATGARAPVRFSPDGRYVAFGNGRVVPAAGGPVTRPLQTVGAWAWAPRGHELAAVTARGGVVIGGPGRPAKRLLADGRGAGGIAFAPDGSLTVSRANEVWTFSGPNLTPGQVLASRAPLEIATWSPDSQWLYYWVRPGNSNSLAADGLPLYVKRRAGGVTGGRLLKMLAYDDFLTWCGNRLVAVAGGDRFTTKSKRLVVVSPSGVRNLWPRATAPACSPDGRSVAAARTRSIWIVGKRRLTVPPSGTSDEAPRWTSDGSAILFWRTRADGRGSLHGVRPGGGRAFGPLAHAGSVTNYYGHYNWRDSSDYYFMQG